MHIPQGVVAAAEEAIPIVVSERIDLSTLCEISFSSFKSLFIRQSPFLQNFDR
jgi:hypothetical protein